MSSATVKKIYAQFFLFYYEDKMPLDRREIMLKPKRIRSTNNTLEKQWITSTTNSTDGKIIAWAAAKQITVRDILGKKRSEEN